MAGSSHTQSLPTELFETYADIWEKFAEHEMDIWYDNMLPCILASTFLNLRFFH
jgi:hypothetical protein